MRQFGNACIDEGRFGTPKSNAIEGVEHLGAKLQFVRVIAAE